MSNELTSLLATRQRALDFAAFGLVLPNPDPILKAQGKDISTYRDLRTDAHVGGCIRRRKSAVKALESGLDRGRSPSRVAKAIESLLADLDLDRIIGEMMEAVLYGYQPLEVMWQRQGSLMVPADAIGKPPEWFCFDPDNALRLKTREQPLYGELLPAMKFLLPRQDATYQNPYGFADLSMCFWPIFFKKGGIKLWLQFVEKFGSAFSVGKLPRGATPAERGELLDSLEALIANGVATIPDDGSVELIELAGKGASADLYERLAMFCRSEVSIALTGTNQTTEASSNKASATAGLQVAHDLRDGDAEIVAGAINQLIRWVVDLNWGGAEAPVFSFWDQEAQDKLQAERDKSNYDAGARYTNAYWMRAYGYQEGDLAAPQASPVISAQATGIHGAEGSPAFAEAGLPAVDDALATQLADAAAAPIGDLLAAVGKMIEDATDMPSLQAALLNAYGGLDTEDLTRLMAAAFALAEQKGMAAVQDEAGA